MDEFELIGRCFRDRTTRRPGTVLGIGDDAALLDTGGLPLVQAGATVACSSREDAAGTARHVFGAAFLRLAACAARPRWATLGLTLEAGDPGWVDSFAAAAATVCDACAVELIGGDTTRGPGRATVFALGTGAALPRRTARSRPASAISVRLALRSTEPPASALADLVAVCADLAMRGAKLQYRDTPDAGGHPPVPQLVAYTDSAGKSALRAVAARWRLETTIRRATD